MIEGVRITNADLFGEVEETTHKMETAMSTIKHTKKWRDESLLDGCTIYEDLGYRNTSGHFVVIILRDESPWEDKRYAVLCLRTEGAVFSFYDGSYDLTLADALIERKRRAV